MQVPKLLTPLDEDTLAAVLRDGHQHVFDCFPSRNRLACAWSHNAHEHGAGRFVYNRNLGNITTAHPDVDDYYEIDCNERTHFGTGPGDPDVWHVTPMRFRAHPDAIEGAWAYWVLMSQRYGKALSLFDAGDPNGAAFALSQAHYFTALPGPYAADMTRLVAHFMAHVGPDLEGSIAPVPDVGPEVAVALDVGSRALPIGASFHRAA